MELEKLIKIWNLKNPNDELTNENFEDRNSLRKTIAKIGVDQFIKYFPIHIDVREFEDGNTHKTEYIYDLHNYRLTIFSVENSGGKYKAQRLFKI